MLTPAVRDLGKVQHRLGLSQHAQDGSADETDAVARWSVSKQRRGQWARRHAVAQEPRGRAWLREDGISRREASMRGNMRVLKSNMNMLIFVLLSWEFTAPPT